MRSSDVERDHFRHLIRMQCDNALPHHLKSLTRGLDDQQLLLVAAEFAIPTISLNNAGDAVDASCEPFFDEHGGDVLSALLIRAGA